MDHSWHSSDIHASTTTNISHNNVPISNGYANTSIHLKDETGESDERAGVFDYVPQQSSLKKIDSFCTHSPSSIPEIDNDSRCGVNLDHSWAKESTSCDVHIDYLADRELTTFRCTSGGMFKDQNCAHKDHLNANGVISADNMADVFMPLDKEANIEGCLQEVLVQPNNSQLTRSSRYSTTNNTSSVYVTNNQHPADEHSVSSWADYGDERDVVARRQSQNSQYGTFSSSGHSFNTSSDVEPMDSSPTSPPLSNAATPVDNDSSTSGIVGSADETTSQQLHRPFGSNIFYLNEFPMWAARSAGSLMSAADAADDSLSSRYYGSSSGTGPRNDATRRLLRKLQKRRLDQGSSNGKAVRSEDVAEYKGDRSVDEVLAFINDIKLAKKSGSSTTAVVASKEKVSRRKKHNTEVESSVVVSQKSSDTTSSSVHDDQSVSSGSEASPTASDANSSDVLSSHKSSDDTTLPLIDSYGQNTEEVSKESGALNEQDQFVIVQKKRKPKQVPHHSVQPNKHHLTDNGRRKYHSYQMPHLQHVNGYPVDVADSCDTNSRQTYTDVDSVSLTTSDTESSSSHVPPPPCKVASSSGMHLCSTDFPELYIDRVVSESPRRNSTGNVSDLASGKGNKIQATPSYAVIAAVGLSGANANQDRRKSLESAEINSFESTVEQTDNCQKSSSAEKAAAVLTSLPADYAVMQPLSHCSRPVLCSSHVNSDENICLVDNSVSSEIASRSKTCDVTVINGPCERIAVSESPFMESCGVKDCAKSVDVQVSTILSFSKQKAVDNQPSTVASQSAEIIADKKTKLQECPVVFLDAATDLAKRHSGSAVDIGISFGFDDAVDGMSVVTDCVAPTTCARCAEHCTKAEKQLTTCTSSATSPMEPNEFLSCTASKNLLGRTQAAHLPAGYGRPIGALSVMVAHSSLPVGIVPPIPQIERTATAATDPKDLLDVKIKSFACRDISTAAACSNEDDVRCFESSNECLVINKSPSVVTIQDVVKSVECKSLACESATAVVDSAVDEAENSFSASSRPGSFCLLSAQLFLYKGFEDVLAEKNTRPDKVLHYDAGET